MIPEITVLSSMATRSMLTVLAELYERRSGQGITITSIGGVKAAERIRAGAETDIVVLASQVMVELENEGHLVPGSRQAIAASGIAVAVRANVPRPVIDSESDVRRAISEAGSIAYSTGPSGDHLKRLLKSWGIEANVADRLVRAPPGVSVGSLLARGAAELGVQQSSEFIGIGGIEVLGPLPAAIQSTTIFAAGIGRAYSKAANAKAFLAFLASPENDVVKRDHGMQPA